MDLIICLFIFSVVVFTLLGIFKTMSRYDIYQKRLEMLDESDNESKALGVNLVDLFRNLLRKISSLFATRGMTENFQAQLLAAGIPLKGEEYIAFCLLTIILLPVIAFLLTANLYLSLIALVSAGLFPRIYLKQKKNKRLRNLNQQLGDALLVMANALRAGFGFQQAMDTVKSELPPPISTEFSWALREMNLGASQEEALINMGERVGSEDLDMLISGIIIQKQVGGNLAQILDNISTTMRERARIKREVHILTAQGKLSGMIIGFLPVVLVAVMLIINPDYFNTMLNDSRGLAVLAIASGLEILGILIIRRIIDINL